MGIPLQFEMRLGRITHAGGRLSLNRFAADGSVARLAGLAIAFRTNNHFQVLVLDSEPDRPTIRADWTDRTAAAGIHCAFSGGVANPWARKRLARVRARASDELRIAIACFPRNASKTP